MHGRGKVASESVSRCDKPSMSRTCWIVAKMGPVRNVRQVRVYDSVAKTLHSCKGGSKAVRSGIRGLRVDVMAFQVRRRTIDTYMRVCVQRHPKFRRVRLLERRCEWWMIYGRRMM